jgi:hypothetical protein
LLALHLISSMIDDNWTAAMTEKKILKAEAKDLV